MLRTGIDANNVQGEAEARGGTTGGFWGANVRPQGCAKGVPFEESGTLKSYRGRGEDVGMG